MPRTTWTFHTAGQLLFGPHASERVGSLTRELGGERTLIVTDRALVSAGLTDRLQGSLAGAGVEHALFDGGEPEPSMEAAVACEARAREFRPDVLIGLGGGSNMDLAKITAVLLRYGGHPRDYVGENRIPGPVLPVIAVSTTAGTGSEVSAASVLTDREQRTKVGVLSNHLRPQVAVVDPLLTVSCPPHVTADSGIDALTHALEAYTAIDNPDFPLPPDQVSVYQGRHPLGEALAERAIQLVFQHLPAAVREGQDLEAREGMHLGSLLAGMSFSNIGVAVVHALEYPIGVATHCSHGRGNGLLLPYVLEFNKPACTPQLARVAALLGLPAAAESQEAAADAAIQAVRELRREIGIPDRLRELGVREEQLRGFAEIAGVFQRILRVNPRPVTVDDLHGILRSAL